MFWAGDGSNQASSVNRFSQMPRCQVRVSQGGDNVPMPQDLLDRHEINPSHAPATGGGMPERMPTSSLDSGMQLVEELRRRREVSHLSR
jgi:hypothetical protein